MDDFRSLMHLTGEASSNYFWHFITGVNDNGDKSTTDVNDTGYKFTAGINNTGDKFTTGFIVTSDKFISGIYLRCQKQG